MRKIALFVTALFLVSFALAQAGDAPAKMAKKTHDMTVQIVSMDMDTKMMTVKDEKGEEHTAPVLGKAVEMMKMFKAGDKVMVTCQDNEKGEHEGVTAIKAAKPMSK